MQIQEQLIADIAREVVARLRVQMQQPRPGRQYRSVPAPGRWRVRNRGRSGQRGL